jgi:hypothetical protein
VRKTFERARGMFHEDVVSAAEDVVRIGRIREKLFRPARPVPTLRSGTWSPRSRRCSTWAVNQVSVRNPQ